VLTSLPPTIDENGRAYPEYLIRYYKGPRKPHLTKYDSRQRAGASTTPAAKKWDVKQAAKAGSQAQLFVAPDIETGVPPASATLNRRQSPTPYQKPGPVASRATPPSSPPRAHTGGPRVWEYEDAQAAGGWGTFNPQCQQIINDNLARGNAKFSMPITLPNGTQFSYNIDTTAKTQTNSTTVRRRSKPFSVFARVWLCMGSAIGVCVAGHAAQASCVSTTVRSP
jgi:hypothetical protein